MHRGFVVAFLRSIANNKLLTAINVVGLGVSFAVALLIALFVQYETSYDKFIEEFENVYLLGNTIGVPGRSPVDLQRTPIELANLLKQNFQTIESVARLRPEPVGLRRDEFEARELIYWADSKLFDILRLPVVSGDLNSALDRPDGLVLTRSLARKYFGYDIPIGETLEVDREHTMTVTAILEDLPENSHLDSQLFGSSIAEFSPLNQLEEMGAGADTWFATGYVYVRLRTSTDLENLELEMPAFVDRHKGAAKDKGTTFSLYFIPLSSINLHSSIMGLKPGVNQVVLSSISIAGILIVVLACINFVNLTTAHSSQRFIEIGMKKVFGAYRSNLMIQFISEAMIYVTLGTLIGIILVQLTLPTFNFYLDRNISLADLNYPVVLISILSSIFLVGVAAGAYPAFFLSSFHPVTVLRGRTLPLGSKASLSRLLVLFQFSVLILMIVATSVVYLQTEYALEDGSSVNTENVLLIETSCRGAFKDEVVKLPGVSSAACSWLNGVESGPPSGNYSGLDGQDVTLSYAPIDFGYFELYEVPVVAGRIFSEQFATDSDPSAENTSRRASIVFNESGARKLGFSNASEAIGYLLRPSGMREEDLHLEIIGVVADFSIETIREEIPPMFYYVNSNTSRWLNVKLIGDNLRETLRSIDDLWSELGEPRPIARFFLEQRLESLYSDLIRQTQMFAFFSGVAIFVACLGLFGLSVVSSETRKNEIAIRKVFGASVFRIARLLVWQFTIPVVFANAIALPLGFVLMSLWLDRFAYHFELNVFLFVVIGFICILIGWLTVTFHILISANSLPSTVLRALSD